MATIEHCIFCFETLHAELTHRKALTLEEVQKSYGEYLAQKTGGDKPKQLPALRRLAEDATSSVSSSGGSSASTSTTSLSNGSAASAASSATSVSMIDAPDVPSETPLFVTWNTVEDSVQDQDLAGGDEDEDGTEHVLRGCIGTFDTVPLEEGLSTYALTAALEDTRFHPISRRELRNLEVAVTLLTDFETARGGSEDWELGKHGLRISFVVNGFQYGSTYLPDVAVEQGWTKEQTVLNLMRKAGWSGRRDSWRKVNLRIVRYQGRKKSLTYRKFMAWREWADAQAATAATATTAAAK